MTLSEFNRTKPRDNYNKCFQALTNDVKTEPSSTVYK